MELTEKIDRTTDEAIRKPQCILKYEDMGAVDKNGMTLSSVQRVLKMISDANHPLRLTGRHLISLVPSSEKKKAAQKQCLVPSKIKKKVAAQAIF
ncbi:hypothetical protein JTB14_024353 [Gonioctena quinquepunctata]|nr:hypothetical protein JTB14_024353 [Gonioctena quinquepunctata]